MEDAFARHSGLPNWMWLEFLLALRRNPEAGPMFAQSAAEHTISLTASFRPFESALTKYYEVPTFDENGNSLWGFLPLATPIVNYQPKSVCFGHYRQILKQMNRTEQGRLGSLELSGIKNGKELVQEYGPTGGFEVCASSLPSIASDSFVMLRQPDQSFRLVRYETVRDRTLASQIRLTGFRLETNDSNSARITEREFPKTRIRAVIPPQDVTIKRIQQSLETMNSADGSLYGRDYYSRLWCSNNHIPKIGEGMALVNLSGLRIEAHCFEAREAISSKPNSHCEPQISTKPAASRTDDL